MKLGKSQELLSRGGEPPRVVRVTLLHFCSYQRTIQLELLDPSSQSHHSPDMEPWASNISEPPFPITKIEIMVVVKIQ